MSTPDPSYSTAEAARLLGVSVPTVQRWSDLGYLSGWKTVGGHRRIDVDSVRRFVVKHGLGAAAVAATQGPRPAARAAAQPVTVLVVDDNPDDRDILCALVESVFPDARLMLATNGFEALLAIGRSRPEVVISDIMMPHMNGLEMLRHLRAGADPAPRLIVAVSSETPRSLAHLGALPRGVPFVQKPIDPAAFAAVLRDGLGIAPAGKRAPGRTAR